MQKYLAYNYEGAPFDVLGTGHLLALSMIAAVIIFLIWGWRDPDEHAKRRARYALAGVMLIVESSWHIWNVANDTWNIQRHLPLHTCSMGVWLSMVMLMTRNYRLYEVLYFVGIAGATQALLTPTLGIYGLPHFWAIQSLSSHGLLVIALVFMTSIEGFRPAWMSIWRTMLILNLYMLLVTGFNYLIGSNYMFTLRKPATVSLFDVMGPWPWYIFTAELVAIVLFSILYLPFAFRQEQPIKD
jgi:hypothetical integral membrane protein (TIGR02206 family)